jgi:surfeit locus 1 family protein
MNYVFRPTFLAILIVLTGCSLLINLGFWQLNRGAMKTLVQKEYALRHKETLTTDALETPDKDLRFFHIILYGKFDNLHSILLDNRIVNHQPGYTLYTPFFIFNNKKAILVDRGFVPQGPSRNVLPDIEPLFGEQAIEGILNIPPAAGLNVGTPEKWNGAWPLRTPTIHLAILEKQLNIPLYSYVLLQNQKDSPSVGMSPEKHVAYAIQWFMLAGVFLIGFIAINIKKKTL